MPLTRLQRFLFIALSCGPIADRFPASKLLASSLWMTALGGIYMSTFPSAGESLVLWGFFGISIILLYWPERTLFCPLRRKSCTDGANGYRSRFCFYQGSPC